MKITTTLFLITFVWTVAKGQDEPFFSHHALSFVANGYVFTGAPYIGLQGQFGLKYDWLINRNIYLSSGLQTFRIIDDESSYFAVPVEINFGTDMDQLGIAFGGGIIFHQESEFFGPVVSPTSHIHIRLKSNRSRVFVDLLAKILFSTKYESRAGTYSAPFDRKGWTFSPGLGINIGFFL